MLDHFVFIHLLFIITPFVCSVRSETLTYELTLCTLDNARGSNNVTLHEVPIPSYVQQILAQRAISEDPLYRFGEKEVSWMVFDNWTYTCHFQTPPGFLDRPSVMLHLGGVDTIAEILLNNELVAHVHNAHRSYCFDITGRLQSIEAGNTLAIHLKSAPAFGAETSEAYPYELPHVSHSTYPHYNFVRKPAADFGWDWGPGIAPVGLPGKIVLAARSEPEIEEVAIAQKHHSNGTVFLTVSVSVLGHHIVKDSSGCNLSVDVMGEDGVCYSGWSLVSTDNATTPVRLLIDPPPLLWWPWDMGQPNLYNLSVHLECSIGGAKVVSSSTKSIGFREIDVVREPLLGGEESFYVQVNGQPLFITGANIVPPRIFRTDDTEEILMRLVDDAKSAHMNMLRVWGGGRYLSEAFYSRADTVGMLIWQEAMFACAPYPSNQLFKDGVGLEVREQVQRLSSHPSVALWGGNNEVENSFQWYPQTRKNLALYAVDYYELFVVTIREQVHAVDPAMIYIDGSPTNGLFSVTPYTKRWGIDVNDVTKGDVHFYRYNDDWLEPSNYPKPKFVSEWGVMSWPSFEAYAAQTVPQDWALAAEMTRFRQRHTNGTEEITKQLQRHFISKHICCSSLMETRSMMLFKEWIYLTQVLQALTYDTAVNHWRRAKGISNVMGVLYWQLNDVWAGPSWSSINHDGSWKPAHYMVQRAYAPLSVSAYFDKGLERVAVWLINDLSLDQTGKLSVEAIPYDCKNRGDIKLIFESDGLSIAGSTSRQVAMVEMPRVLSKQRNHFLRASFCPSNKGQCQESIVVFSKYKHIPRLQDTEVKITHLHNNTVTIRSYGVPFHIFLSTQVPGRFVENFIAFMLPDEERKIEFKPHDSNCTLIDGEQIEIRWLQRAMKAVEEHANDVTVVY